MVSFDGVYSRALINLPVDLSLDAFAARCRCEDTRHIDAILE